MKFFRALSFVAIVALCASAASEARAYDKQSVSKFKQSILKEMCNDGGDWMRCYKLDPVSCRDINTDLVESCVDAELSKTKSLEYKQYVRWMSEGVYSCMKNGFLKKYGAQKVNSEECSG